MNCELLHRRITDHREGTLDPDMCSAIERHLKECASCGELHQDLEDLARLCRQAKQGSAQRLPADVRARIESLLHAQA